MCTTDSIYKKKQISRTCKGMTYAVVQGLLIEEVVEMLILADPIDLIEPIRDSLSRKHSPVSGSTFHSTRTARGPGGGGVPMLRIDPLEPLE